METKKVNVSVIMGMSPKCTAELDPAEVVGVIARDIIMSVIGSTQPTPETQHTAMVLAKSVAVNAELDVELTKGKYNPNKMGNPISLNDKVIPNEQEIPETKELTIAVADSFRAG